MRKPGRVEVVRVRFAMDRNYFRRTTLKSPTIRYARELSRSPGNSPSQEDVIHDEEDCTGITACFHTISCGIVCAGCDSHWSTSAHTRRPRPAAGTGLRVDKRLPTLR